LERSVDLDTGTHLVVGLGLAGLAYIDPVVAADPHVSTAVLIGTVLGSQIPDADTLFRLKSNAAYIRNHRGGSHSLPAVAAWTLLITSLLALLFGPLPIWHVGFWVFIAVGLHVFSDCFNTYGTQAARPITSRWISWNIIHIFDPFIFAAHLGALLIWSLRLLPPQMIFSWLYAIIVVYYIWRTIAHYMEERKLPQLDKSYQEGDRYFLIPTVSWSVWNVVKRRQDGTYAVGDQRNGSLRWIEDVRCDSHPAVDASKAHPDVGAFLYFSSFACAELKSHPWGYEVRWADIRYRHRKQYPFVAVLLLDKDLQPLDSYVGWLSETRLEKRLRVDTY
jgi:inner membrane protein